MLIYIILAVVILALKLLGCWALMIRMPGKSHQGSLPSLTREEEKMAGRMEKNLNVLAGEIGERNLQRRYDELIRAAAFIQEELHGMGYQVARQEYEARGRTVWNLWGEIKGSSMGDEIVVIGSHYDTVPHSPGADDNGSAVVANLELARAFSKRTPERTVRFVFFVNEEYPFFMTPEMGSLVFAGSCAKKKEKITGMLCLETMGYYYEKPGTQKYPWPLQSLYPSTADFISFVGNLRSRAFVHQVIRSFRRHTRFPSQGIAALELIRDICRSDHYPFWKEGWPALMVTDTANFRYAHYHTSSDLPREINYESLSRVTAGLIRVVDELAG